MPQQEPVQSPSPNQQAAPVETPPCVLPFEPRKRGKGFTDSDIENRFRYHPPKSASRVARHEAVSRLTEQLGKHLADICPASRGLSCAMTALEECRMWANQAIACDSPDDS